MADVQNSNRLLIIKDSKIDDVRSHWQRANRKSELWTLMARNRTVRELLQWLQPIQQPRDHGVRILNGVS